MPGSAIEPPPRGDLLVAPTRRRSRLVLALETVLHTILFPGAVMVGFPAMILGISGRVPPARLGWLQLVAIIPIGIGVAIGSYCTRDFIEVGQGTPNPLDPPRFLVAGRFYRVVRNPMYVAVELILLGEALAFASPGLLAYAASAWVVFHLVVVLYEEPTLRRTFGASYDAYCREVPRWFPRLKALFHRADRTG